MEKYVIPSSLWKSEHEEIAARILFKCKENWKFWAISYKSILWDFIEEYKNYNDSTKKDVDNIITKKEDKKEEKFSVILIQLLWWNDILNSSIHSIINKNYLIINEENTHLEPTEKLISKLLEKN